MSAPVSASLRFLLLQVRNADDPMRQHERLAFTRSLAIEPDRCDTVDLLSSRPSPAQLAATDVVLLGGSGDYSAGGEGQWLDRSLDLLREIVQELFEEQRLPDFLFLLLL